MRQERGGEAHRAADSARRVRQKVEKGKIRIALKQEQMNHCLSPRIGAILGKKQQHLGDD